MKNIDYVKEKYYKDDKLSRSDIMDLFCPHDIEIHLRELKCNEYECDCEYCWNLEVKNK